MCMIQSDLAGNCEAGQSPGTRLTLLFELLDQFNCHAGNVDQMRFHYKETLADLADSEILSDLFSQIYGCKIEYNKLSNDLGDKIRASNYAIC